MSDRGEYLGYIRYSGISVNEGYLDARTAAEALIGIDEAIRLFVARQAPHLSKLQYELPVRVRKGSWESIIPDSVVDWVIAALGAGATSYVTAAAATIAKNDFDEASTRKAFRRAIQAIQWVIRIGKHLGTVAKRSFDNVQWKDRNTTIGIPNTSGEYLYVPKYFYDLYVKMPVNLLAKIVAPVSDDRELSVGVRGEEEDEIVSVGMEHRSVFCPDTSDTLFPELTHGLNVVLDGVVTRGNENSNTIGFQYHDHILTCYPKDGSIVRHKSELFLRCRIVGTVTRSDKWGEPTEKRPKIEFEDLVPLQKEEKPPLAPGLFDDES